MKPQLEKLDWKVIFVITSSTLIVSVDHYRTVFTNFRLDLLLFYLVIPLGIIVIVLREPPRRYGFRIGDWRSGLPITLACMIGITLFAPFVAPQRAFSQYYAAPTTALPNLIANNFVELLGWEFFFRGFLLFALVRVAGPYAIILQAVPFTILHFGKPELETLSCIFGGSLFGYVAWRTRSFLYPLLIHTYLAVVITLLA